MNPLKPKRGEPGYVSPLTGRRGMMSPEGKARMIAANTRPRGTLEERFWQKVQKTDSCWLWTGATRHWGYGCIWSAGSKGRILVAHRVSWEIHNGPIPEGMVLDHICKVPRCVNPAHLRVVTTRENYVDYSDSPLAANAKKSHCPQGHPYSIDNIAIVRRTKMRSGNGKRVGKTIGRICLTCHPTYWRHALIARLPPPSARLKAGEVAKYRNVSECPSTGHSEKT